MKAFPFLLLLLSSSLFSQPPLHQRAVNAFERRQWMECVNMCKDFLFLYPDEEGADRICFLLAESLYLLSSYKEALRYYRELLHRYPNSLYTKPASIKIGDCLIRLGRNREAASHLLKIKDDFKNTLEYDYIEYLLRFCRKK